MVSGREHVVAWRAEPGYDKHSVSVPQQPGNDRPAVEGPDLVGHHCFTPESRCEMMTATC